MHPRHGPYRRADALRAPGARDLGGRQCGDPECDGAAGHTVSIPCPRPRRITASRTLHSCPALEGGRVDELRVLTQGEADTEAAGPKAAVLARAAAAGMPVPPFFVVPADAHREHAARAGVTAALTETVPLTIADASRFREAIAAAPLAPGLRESIAAALATLGGPPVAVRSSGTAEDLPGLSFAGQHGT
ncbi:MAG: hypothetical protein FDZ70_09695, partial [Actinobacteria bacterium]